MLGWEDGINTTLAVFIADSTDDIRKTMIHIKLKDLEEQMAIFIFISFNHIMSFWLASKKCMYPLIALTNMSNCIT